MDYKEAVDFLFNRTQSFEHHGAVGYKPGLEGIRNLLDYFDNPHAELRTVHVAGTNGKGSTSALIASVLQAQGYKTGLFSSPHFVDFRERIRIDGKMISEPEVVEFVEKVAKYISSSGHVPSFFEVTTAMAFYCFKSREVDFAVIEVGMGGRLDSTNVLIPIVSVITNVSLDHTQYLGDTLGKIAYEKAGIIKQGIPVVLGNSREPEVRSVVSTVANQLLAPLVFADRVMEIMMHFEIESGHKLSTSHFGNLDLPLYGSFQIENASTALQALLTLRDNGIVVSQDAVKRGFQSVLMQGISGRMQVIKESNPRIIVDSGHNPAAWDYISSYLFDQSKRSPLVCILGFSNDKDVSTILDKLPRDLRIIFTQSQTPRAKPTSQLMSLAQKKGFRNVQEMRDIASSYIYSLDMEKEVDNYTIFVGGSFYLIGELYSLLNIHKD